MSNRSAIPSTRNYSLDAARGILMMLGVLLHAANIYTVEGGWLVEDAQRSLAFDYISNAIHVFRMPAFFWISGYFCALTFARSGSQGLLRTRLPRLFVPLISTWITLNLAQKLFVASLTGQGLVDALSSGVPLYHLWFLVDLMVFIGVAAAILPRVQRFGFIGCRLEALPLALMILILALFGSLVGVAARATGVAYDSFLGLTSLFRLATYAPFFAVGVLMHGHSGLRKNFLRVPTPLIFASLPLALWAHGYTRGQGFVVSEMAIFVETIMVWLSVAVVLRLFHDLVREGSRLTRLLSESAYSVYLFHHIVVVVIGLILLDYPIGAWLKFLIVGTTSLSVAMLVHVTMIRRNRVARLLFNGK
jgi:glucan biosynthesis protein C